MRAQKYNDTLYSLRYECCTYDTKMIYCAAQSTFIDQYHIYLLTYKTKKKKGDDRKPVKLLFAHRKLTGVINKVKILSIPIPTQYVLIAWTNLGYFDRIQ